MFASVLRSRHFFSTTSPIYKKTISILDGKISNSQELNFINRRFAMWASRKPELSPMNWQKSTSKAGFIAQPSGKRIHLLLKADASILDSERIENRELCRRRSSVACGDARYGAVLSLAWFGEAVEGGEHRAFRRETAGRCESGPSDGGILAVSAMYASRSALRSQRRADMATSG